MGPIADSGLCTVRRTDDQALTYSHLTAEKAVISAGGPEVVNPLRARSTATVAYNLGVTRDDKAQSLCSPPWCYSTSGCSPAQPPELCKDL